MRKKDDAIIECFVNILIMDGDMFGVGMELGILDKFNHGNLDLPRGECGKRREDQEGFHDQGLPHLRCVRQRG